MGDAYTEGLKAILPELVLTSTAFAALVLDLLKKGRDSRLVGYLTLGGLALTGLMLFGQWGPCGDGCYADLNLDGTVDAIDLMNQLANWGPCTP